MAYFIDEIHENNFIKTLEKWGIAKENKEYKTACYVLSVPMIFEKVGDKLAEFESPIDWIYDYECLYNKELIEELEINDAAPINYDLTESMRQLGKLSLNLWNSYKHFNLFHCLSSLDREHFLVAKEAINIRMGE